MFSIRGLYCGLLADFCVLLWSRVAKCQNSNALIYLNIHSLRPNIPISNSEDSLVNVENVFLIPSLVLLGLVIA